MNAGRQYGAAPCDEARIAGAAMNRTAVTRYDHNYEDSRRRRRVPPRCGRTWASARHGLILGTACFCALPLTGCAGGASLHMIPLSTKKISMTRPLVIQVKPEECYYWVSEKQTLAVAMRLRERSLLGARYEREFVLSLMLDGLPASRSRAYRVGRRAMRARDRAGYSHTRSASLLGLVTVWDYGRPRLRGRFRITTKQQSYSVLTGWTGDRRVLFVGEFAAVLDRAAGEKILEQTEKDGMARAPARGTPIPIKGPPRDKPPPPKPGSETESDKDAA